MSRKSFFSLALIAPVCFVGLATAADQPSAAKPEQVRIKFDWPAGLSARITATNSKSRSKDGGAPAVNQLTMNYTMKTVRHDRGLTVSFGDLALTGPALKDVPEQPRAMLELFTKAALPSYIVSGEGDFIELEDYAAFAKAVRRAFDLTLPPGSTQHRNPALIDQLVSKPILSALANAEWNGWVGSWSGTAQTFALAEEYSWKSQVVMPLVNRPVETRTTLVFMRKLQCERGGQTLECVELLAVDRPDPEQTAVAIAKLVDSLTPEALAKFRVETLSVTTTIELVTETATLIPHRFHRLKNVSMTALEDGKKVTGQTLEESQLEFSYAAGK